MILVSMKEMKIREMKTRKGFTDASFGGPRGSSLFVNKWVMARGTNRACKIPGFRRRPQTHRTLAASPVGKRPFAWFDSLSPTLPRSYAPTPDNCEENESPPIASRVRTGTDVSSISSLPKSHPSEINISAGTVSLVPPRQKV